jgi:6-phosphogluconolactonase
MPGDHGDREVIRMYPDYETLSRAAAELFIQEAQEAVGEKGGFTVALSGGNTPRRTYEILGDDDHQKRVDWRYVHIFWGDERCLPPNHPETNEHMARQCLIDHVPVPEKQVYPIRCAASPENAARHYDALLRTYFGSGPAGFDLVFLGLGQNGHTASLFPGSAVLNERNRWVAEVYVPLQAFHRVSLTVPIINMAKTTAFLVVGEKKSAVLKDVLEGSHDPDRLPAQLIKPVNGTLLWLVDNDAGRLITVQKGCKNACRTVTAAGT